MDGEIADPLFNRFAFLEQDLVEVLDECVYDFRRGTRTLGAATQFLERCRERIEVMQQKVDEREKTLSHEALRRT